MSKYEESKSSAVEDAYSGKQWITEFAANMKMNRAKKECLFGQ